MKIEELKWQVQYFVRQFQWQSPQYHANPVSTPMQSHLLADIPAMEEVIQTAKSTHKDSHLQYIP